VARTRLTIQAIDLHCGGEPLRLITAGYPPVPDLPILERRAWVREHADVVRRVAMYEPRGHRDMYGAVLLPPHRPDADLAILFMHNEGYSTMCGHGTLAVSTALVEEGLFPVSTPETVIRLEAPAGLVTARVAVSQTDGGAALVERASFGNVPSYLAATDLQVRPDGVELHGAAADRGALSADIGFGGAYYGIVDAAELGMRVVGRNIEALTRAGAAITELLRRDFPVHHPEEPDLSFVYGTIIVDRSPAASGDGLAEDADWRNVTIFADAEVDRSPCGSGTSALLAQGAARGRLAIGQEIANTSITGAIFHGRLDGETTLGPHQAYETSISGRAYVTGYQTLVVDERDPLGEGFLLR
jgi:trans-L-3-hydroxyproline dehydratase